ncbi:MAG: hypothetical protein K6A32_09810, partial [Bacteroidales bacterium]|nr:hypothetical protein [Bacteroidales bacterium]
FNRVELTLTTPPSGGLLELRIFDSEDKEKLNPLAKAIGHTSGRSASHVRSHSLKRRVAQPHATGRSAPCDRSLSLMRMDVHALVDSA